MLERYAFFSPVMAVAARACASDAAFKAASRRSL
jgi:hypothetical protein